MPKYEAIISQFVRYLKSLTCFPIRDMPLVYNYFEVMWFAE